MCWSFSGGALWQVHRMSLAKMAVARITFKASS